MDGVREPALQPLDRRDSFRRVSPGITLLRTLIVNLYFVEVEGGWVLVDAGLPGSAAAIRRRARQLFGGRPALAIVLTHGHFDHVGALRELAAEWGAPVFAHRLELPYLNGTSAYPPPDPSVGGGLMARIAPLYPRGPVDVTSHLEALPADGGIPFMPGWRWIHTPGHTPGHVSLFREADRTLIAGDAFITVNQESALDVMRQRPVVSGPPAYYTQDWASARRSTAELLALGPAVAATGHGVPLGGERLRLGLERLVADFDRVALPRRGRYVGRPVIASEDGTEWVPPPERGGSGTLLLGAAVVAAAFALASALGRRARVRR